LSNIILAFALMPISAEQRGDEAIPTPSGVGPATRARPDQGVRNNRDLTPR